MKEIELHLESLVYPQENVVVRQASHQHGGLAYRSIIDKYASNYILSSSIRRLEKSNNFNDFLKYKKRNIFAPH